MCLYFSGYIDLHAVHIEDYENIHKKLSTACFYEWKLIFHYQQRCVATYKGHLRSQRKNMAHFLSGSVLLKDLESKKYLKKMLSISSGDFNYIYNFLIIYKTYLSNTKSVCNVKDKTTPKEPFSWAHYTEQSNSILIPYQQLPTENLMAHCHCPPTRQEACLFPWPPAQAAYLCPPLQKNREHIHIPKSILNQ